MPVEKFRSFDAARDAQRSESGSDVNIRRMRAVLEFWSIARPKTIRRGVFKYRSVQEAQDAALSQP